MVPIIQGVDGWMVEKGQRRITRSLPVAPAGASVSGSCFQPFSTWIELSSLLDLLEPSPLTSCRPCSLNVVTDARTSLDEAIDNFSPGFPQCHSIGSATNSSESLVCNETLHNSTQLGYYYSTLRVLDPPRVLGYFIVYTLV